MNDFTMEIAGLVIRVQPLFESTREYCKAYLCDKDPDFQVAVSREDLVFEQKMLEREAVEEGLKIRRFTDPFLERITIQHRAAEQLLHRNTLMLHGSAVSVDGRAYLFTAPCGTGKSTHTKLWRELFGERAVMINDDNVFLRITSTGVVAYGSPWSGKHGLHSNVCVPLKGICLLQRGEDNRIDRVDHIRAIAALSDQIYAPTDVALRDKSIALVNALSEAVPLWEMHCNKEPDAAKVSYCEMSRDDV